MRRFFLFFLILILATYCTTAAETPEYRYTVARATLDGEVEQILADAVWPVVSPDGAKLAYLSFDHKRTTMSCTWQT